MRAWTVRASLACTLHDVLQMADNLIKGYIGWVYSWLRRTKDVCYSLCNVIRRSHGREPRMSIGTANQKRSWQREDVGFGFCSATRRCLVGSSSNSVERVLSYFEKKYLFLDKRRGVQFLADYGFKNIQLTIIYYNYQKFTIRDIKLIEAYFINELNSSLNSLCIFTPWTFRSSITIH